MNKTLLFLFLVTGSFFAHANDIQFPKEVYGILNSFSEDGESFSGDYIKKFPDSIYGIMLTSERSFFERSKGKCSEILKITFGPKIIASSNVEKSFEEGLIRIEASKCFDTSDSEKLLNIVSSVDFKKSVFSTLEDATLEGENIYCETTSAPTVGDSNYCYLELDLEKADTGISRLNFLTYNNEDEKYDAPIYFRQALQSARTVGTKTQYYTVSYVRATSLSSVQQFFAKNVIKSTQKLFFKKLKENLRQK